MQRHVAVFVLLLLGLPSSQVREPVSSALIGILEILPSWLPTHVAQMQRASRPVTMNPLSSFTTIGP
jgi:hypothetical protein